MTQSASNHYVFYHHTSSRQCIYLIVYVDDIVITGSDKDGIQNLNSISSATFKQLGIEIAQSNSGVVMSQRKYVFDLIEETSMLHCKPVDTPMDPNGKLVPRKGEPLRDSERYRRLVGRLNDLTIT